MIVTGLVLAAVAALIHGYIFWLESFAWTGQRARNIFGTTSDEAAVTAPLARNQGYYNLFLAIEIAAGIVVMVAGGTAVGATLVLVGTGSMVAAGLVLLISDRSKAGAAAKQLVPPLVATIALVIGLIR